MPAIELNVGGALLVAAVAIPLCVAGALVAIWLLRRSWGRLGVWLGRHLRHALLHAAGAGWRWALSRHLPDRQWRSLHVMRRNLLVAVSGSEHAVAVAKAAGAPIGDLESLGRRLREAANAVDASLRIAQRGSAPMTDLATASGQAADLSRTAAQIQGAAALALTAVARPVATELREDTEREVIAIAAGLSRFADGGAGSASGHCAAVESH